MIMNAKPVKRNETNNLKKIDFLKKYDFKNIGHRGARGLAVENTLLAFEKAIEIGVNTLEMDVVVTKDEEILVSHESWMRPNLCILKKNKVKLNENEEHNIYEMNYAETQAYDCGSLVHPKFDEQETESTTKPLLREVLQMAKAISKNHGIKVDFLIEIKSTAETDHIYHPAPKRFVELILKEIKEHAKLKDICLQSFDTRILNEIKRQKPKAQVALLSKNEDLNALLNKLEFTPEVFAPYYKQLTKQMVVEANELNMRVYTWTVNEIEDMRKVLELGVDGVITDYPNRAQNLKRISKF